MKGVERVPRPVVPGTEPLAIDPGWQAAVNEIVRKRLIDMSDARAAIRRNISAGGVVDVLARHALNNRATDELLARLAARVRKLEERLDL